MTLSFVTGARALGCIALFSASVACTLESTDGSTGSSSSSGTSGASYSSTSSSGGRSSSGYTGASSSSGATAHVDAGTTSNSSSSSSSGASTSSSGGTGTGTGHGGACSADAFCAPNLVCNGITGCAVGHFGTDGCSLSCSCSGDAAAADSHLRCSLTCN